MISYPSSSVWYIRVSSKGETTGQGSGVGIRLRKKGQPGTEQTFILTCAHVIRRLGRDDAELGPRHENIRVYPAGYGYDEADGIQVEPVTSVTPLKTFAVGTFYNQPVEDIENADWALLAFTGPRWANSRTSHSLARRWHLANLEPGDQCVISGYPDGEAGFAGNDNGNDNIVRPKPGYALQTIEKVVDNVITFDGIHSRSGMSGGGVFRKDGDNYSLSGLHRARYDERLQLKAVSARSILQRLDELGYEPVEITSQQSAPSGHFLSVKSCISHRSSSHIERPQLLARIIDIVTAHSVCVVLGPSGLGKTTLAEQAASAICSEPPAILGRPHLMTGECTNASVLIVDGVSGGFSPEAFAKQLRIPGPGALIFTTTDPTVASEISRFFRGNESSAIVEIKPFTIEEGLQFFSKKLAPNQISEEERKQLVTALYGVPAALQVIVDFVKDIANPMSAHKVETFISSSKLNKDNIGRVALRQWIMHMANLETQELARVLCKVPFLGMTLPALAHVLQITEAECIERCQVLVEKGFVSCHTTECTSIYEITSMFQPHDLLKNAFAADEHEKSVHSYEVSYVRYLSDKCHTKCGEFSTPEAIDAWVVGVRSLFLDRSERGVGYSVFEARVFRHMALLWKVLQSRSDLQRISNVLTQMTSEKARNASCAELIALAKCVAALPGSSGIADTIWEGTGNESGWARATCAWAAVCHWRQLPEKEQQIGVDRIREWITSRKSLLGRSNDSTRSDFLDWAAVIGGLASLGRVDEALSCLNSIPTADAWAARLAVAVVAFDKGRTDLACNLLQTHDSPYDPVARTLIADYFRGMNGDYSMMKDVRWEGGYHSLANDIGCAAQSEGFLRFVKASEIRSPLQVGMARDTLAEWVKSRSEMNRINEEIDILARRGAYRDIAIFLTESIGENEGDAETLNGIAWILATHPDQRVRNGHDAVKAATSACKLQNWCDYNTLDTLAAAHAEAGDYLSAVAVQEQVIRLHSLSERDDRYQTRLQLYRNGRPFHEAARVVS